MSGAPFLKITYTPDYAEMFAVAAASRRYQFTNYQRYVWWVVVALYFALVFSIATWGDPVERAAAPFIGRAWAEFAPIAVITILGAIFMIAIRRSSQTMSAKWLAQRKPLVPTTFTAGEQHLAWENDEMYSRIRWDAIERLFLTPIAVCFIYGGQTLYVPNRLFAAQTERNGFIRSALKAMSPAAQALSEADPLVKAATT